jgi:hypothetical protein
MYLAEDELRRTLNNIRGLCAHPASRIWIDHVTKELLAMDLPEVRSFLASMARLGEPFVTGFSDPAHLAEQGWCVVENPSAADVLDIREPIHGEYRFALVAPSSGMS